MIFILFGHASVYSFFFENEDDLVRFECTVVIRKLRPDFFYKYSIKMNHSNVFLI